MRDCQMCGQPLPADALSHRRYCPPCGRKRHSRWKERPGHAVSTCDVDKIDPRHLDCMKRGECLKTLLDDKRTCQHLDNCACRLQCSECARYQAPTREEYLADVECLADLLKAIMSPGAGKGRHHGRGTPQRVKMERDRRRAAGLCVLCGQRPAQYERQGCRECYSRMAQRRQERA